MIIAISAMLAITYVNGLYFYIAKGEVKCFKDELIRNSVSYYQTNLLVHIAIKQIYHF